MQLKSRRPRPERRLGLRRRERGATVVLVAVSMVALLGMAAVSVDFAVASDQKASVQNAADTAALALGNECSLKKSGCSTSTSTWYAQQNAGASATVQTLKDGVAKNPSYDDGKATVRVSKNVSHTFARVLGDSSSTVRAEATVNWKSVPLKGAGLIPIGLPYCDWLGAQPSAGGPGAMKSFLWARHSATETSCPGTGATAPTVYGRKGSGTGYTNFGRAMWFTSSVFPGITNNCNYSASLWDLYRDVLDDWTLFGWDSCMTQKLSGVGPGSIVMFPIYALEKKSIFWGAVSYTSRLVVIGFAPFKIDKWLTYPSIYFGTQPSASSIGTSNSCSFGFYIQSGLGNITWGGTCAGVRGQFVRSTEGALFNNFTEYGTSYDNPDSGLSGNAPDLGLTRVKLVR